MFEPSRIFKEPVILEVALHKDLQVSMPSNFLFSRDVEILPICFSELLSVSMYYPVLFGSHSGQIFPFAVLGLNGKNLYLTEEGTFKVEVIPKILSTYPFGVIRKKEDEKEEWVVIVDEIYCGKDGIKIFEEQGEETAEFREIKGKLTELAFDFQQALDFSKEIFEAQLLQLCSEFLVPTKHGSSVFKNIFIANIETLRKISPEKLYYYNANGYLPIIYSIYFSVRNFKLWDLL